MELNASNLQTLFTSVNLKFKEAYNASVNRDYDPFTMEVSMGTSRLELPFLEQLTGMREWIGPRQINNLRLDKLTLVPRSYELTYGIPRDAVEDDTYGMYVPLVSQMGVSAANLPNDLITELLNGAGDKYWIDGKKFFATDRKYGKSTINNYSTNALTASNFKTAYDLMTAYKGHGGQGLKVKPDTVVVGPALRWTAKQLFECPEMEVNGAALPNDLYNIVKVVVMSDITGSKWFLCAGNPAYKPVCYFNRRRPDTIVRKDKATDDNVFVDNQYLYGCDGRAEAAFVLPHLIYFGNPA